MKPQDIVVLSKILLKRNEPWTYQQISNELFISQSECHAAIKRSSLSNLFNGLNKKINKSAFKEFLIYGLRYVYPAEVGKITRGVLTSYAVGPFSDEFVNSDGNLYVWPYALGDSKGQTIKPLYKTVPKIALEDDQFYILMVLIDLIRMGHVRERNKAVKHLSKLLVEDF